MASRIPKLFQPIRVGTANLQHRVVLAPITRNRANEQHVHGALGLEYYKQRTSVPGTLAITEGTFIAPHAGGQNNVPGLWTDAQIAGWKTVRAFLLSFCCNVLLSWDISRRSRTQYTQTGPSFFSRNGFSAVSQKATSFGRRATTPSWVPVPSRWKATRRPEH